MSDPAIIALAARIPVVGLRHPRRRKFRRYCECFEWVFNDQRRREKELNFIRPPVAEFIEHVDLLADALWHHLYPGLRRHHQASQVPA